MHGTDNQIGQTGSSERRARTAGQRRRAVIAVVIVAVLVASIPSTTAQACPDLVGTYSDDLANCSHVAVVGGYAYAVGFEELRVLDISNPAAPTQVGSAATYATNDVWVLGTNATLMHFDGSKWGAPVLLPVTTLVELKDVWGFCP